MGAPIDLKENFAHSIKLAEVFFSTNTCLGVTESGWLVVSWPAVDGVLEDQPLPQEGSDTAPSTHHATFEWSHGVAVTFEMPIALVGDVMLRPYRGATGVVLRHLCPEARHAWLGPWDEATATQLMGAVRTRLSLPRKLGAALRLTEDDLSNDPRRYHGELIRVEGKWLRPVQEEAPTFVARSTLVFPPGFVEPERSIQLLIEGVWIVERPSVVTLGPDRRLYASSIVVTEARTAQCLPQGASIRAPGWNPYVVTIAARTKYDTYDFCVNREFGVCALAAADGGSAFFDFGGFASSLIARTIADNCSDRLGSVDLNVQKFEQPTREAYGASRLVASIKSAYQRLDEDAREHFRERLRACPTVAFPGSASVVAMMPVEAGLVTMQVGTQARIYRVRQGVVDLLTDAEPTLDVLVRELALRPQDIFVMTSTAADGASEALEILARDPFELALAACFRVVRREPLVLVRWLPPA
jgi:hypothetical protein